MKSVLILASLGAALTVTPVQKVIKLLQDMHATGEKQKAEETKIFEDYSEWVDDQVKEKDYEKQTLDDTIAKLIAEIAKAEADSDALSSQVQELIADITRWESQAESATAEREEAKAEYERVSKDYSESVEAIGYAMTVLQQQNFDRKQAESLLQIVAGVPEARSALVSFLQTKDGPSGPPEVAGYTASSGGLIKMLKDLGKKFKEQLQDVQREEQNAAHRFDMEMLNLRDQIRGAQDHKREKEATRAQRQSDLGEYKGELADSKQVLAETIKYVQNVKTTFKIKSNDYKLNQDVRKDELDALTQAVTIISGGAVSGAADKHLPSLAQKSFLQRSLLQLKTLYTQREGGRESAASFLEEKGRSLNSKVLQMAAVQLASKVAQGGPMDKIAKMIQDLITRLETEAASEASHNAWCEDELKENKLTREEKTRRSNELQTKIDKYKASINRLAQQISDLNAQEAALQKAIRDFTAERTKERETNVATIKDAKAAQVALTQALEVLKAFYEKAGSELVQETSHADQVPKMAKYQGQQDSKKGVVGILEVIQTDFARLQADTESAESQGQREFLEFKESAKLDIDAKKKDSAAKGLLEDKDKFDKEKTEKDLRSVLKGLTAANEYYEALKPQCLEVHVSHEERVRLREEEIASLQQAYEILDQKE